MQINIDKTKDRLIINIITLALIECGIISFLLEIEEYKQWVAFYVFVPLAIFLYFTFECFTRTGNNQNTINVLYPEYLEVTTINDRFQEVTNYSKEYVYIKNEDNDKFTIPPGSRMVIKSNIKDCKTKYKPLKEDLTTLSLSYLSLQFLITVTVITYTFNELFRLLN